MKKTQKHMSEESLFKIAVEMEPGTTRDDFLRESCGDNQQLFDRVHLLLQIQHEEPGFLDEPADEFLNRLEGIAENPSGSFESKDSDELVGQYVGPYKLLELIGEGGMGMVFMAQQTEPVRRMVAVKLIKAGMDTKHVIARFETERQALAIMDHPNIAKVFDAGNTDSGRPYFVMELVKGIPITEYCDQHRLDSTTRLTLFRKVCQAVQHAHQKGIIHRDLKPSNVLIAMFDDQPVPKVIDFGVAKATGDQLSDKTLFTRFGQIVGTLEYMSPEQAQFNNLDIDTRSDIYSLGAILCELLSGTPPFDRDTIRNQPLDETLRMIREDDPSRPSAKFSGSMDAVTIAKCRSTSTHELGSSLAGDLDLVIMKSLEKDRARRYETASGLADDIRRFLNNEPVTACPPTSLYLFGKFARRNKAAMVIGSLLGLGVLFGITVLAVSNQMISQREADKQVALKQASDNLQLAQQHQKQAEQNFLNAQTVIEFVKNDIFGMSNTQEQSRFDEYATLAELLDRAAQNLEDRVGLAPHIEAELCLIIGLNYQALDNHNQAIGFLRKSVDLYDGNLQEQIRARNALANVLSLARQNDEALLLQKKCLVMCRTELGDDHPLTLESMQNLAVIHRRVFQLAEAIPLLEKVLEIRKRKLGEDHIDTLKTVSNLGWAFVRAGQKDAAREALERSVAKQTAVLGIDHRDTLDSMNRLSWLYVDLRNYDKVVALREQILDVRKAKLGNDHRDTIKSMKSLVNGYEYDGQSDKAINLLQQILEIQTAKLGEHHLETLNTLSELASINGSEYPPEKKLQLMNQQWVAAKTTLGEDHPKTLKKKGNLAEYFLKNEQFEKALAMYQHILDATKSREGKDLWMTLDAMYKLSYAYRVAGEFDKAILLLQQVVELSNHDFPLTRSDYSYIQGWKHKSLCELGWAYEDAGRIDNAVVVFERVLRMRTKLLGEDDASTLDCMRILGTAHAIAGNFEESLSLLKRTVAIQKTKFGEEHANTLQTMGLLGETYRLAGQFDEAIDVLQRALQSQTRQKGDDHPDTFLSRHLAAAYRSAGQADKAVPILEQMVAQSQAMRGQDHFNSICHANTLASTYLQIGRLDDAEQMLRQSHDHCLRTIPNNWVMFNTMSLLGEALMRQHDYASAESLLLDGYHGLVERKNLIPPFFRLIERGGTGWIGIDVSSSKTRVAEAIERLIQLYEAWHEEQPDDGFDAKAVQWRQKLNEENSNVELIDP